MKRKVKSTISVIYTFIRFCFIKLIRGKDFKFDWVERFSPNVNVEFEKGAEVVLGKKVRAHSGVKLKARNGAMLDIGDNVSFNYGCIAICRKAIKIGSGTEFGPNVVIYDHDHDFRTDGGIRAEKYVSDDVVIGDNCWIGANTVILKGTVLGDDCVVGAGSVIKGNYPQKAVIIQKRHADVISMED